MSFEPLIEIVSKVILLQADNIDTDQIIPARFLKSVESSGFGKNLFHDWRYLPDGTPNRDFVLNHPGRKGQILLTGKNFGCGSSREHAAWALYQFGFRVVISSGFADIFRTNALNNGLLPIEISERQLTGLMKLLQLNPDQTWTVDLKAQVLITSRSAASNNKSESIPFDISMFRKHCLITGSDLIDYLAGKKDQIAEYETNHPIKYF
jgi:3-isopropylmalate/(R)-2-methylmalate dehydratase small subunit